MKEKVFEKIDVANQYEKAISSLRECLHEWENLRPTKAELLNEMVRCIQQLREEVKENLVILEGSLTAADISQKGQACKLKVNAWNQLQRVRNTQERKIRWFLIKKEEGLEEELNRLYENIAHYNISIDELMSFGELITREHMMRINSDREKLHSTIDKTWFRLFPMHF